ncbi:MAG: DedA family protein [Patescibacteria group bacterium]
MFDLVTLLETVGYLGLFAIVFAESGLFIGFFLPGDSLLFTAGILASQGYLQIALVALVCAVGAITGDSFGYWFGRKVGPALFKRDDSLLFHKRHLEQARVFFDRHGAQTIILARFMPVVRTFAPILAGVGEMRYATFALYNVIGGLIWSVGITTLGYYLGTRVPNIDHYLAPGIIIIIILSIIPPIWHIWRERQTKNPKSEILPRRQAGRNPKQ